MNATVEEISAIKRKMTIELPWENADTLEKKLINDFAQHANLKGFRPGKAPKAMVAKAYASNIRQKVVEELVSENLPKALESQNLQPVGTPVLEDVNFTDNQPVKIIISFELKPEITFDKWEGLELQKEKFSIADTDIDTHLEKLRANLSTLKSVDQDRQLELGDVAIISYVGNDSNKKPVAGLKNDNFQVELGSGRFLPEFEAALMGMKKGQSKEVEVNFPKGNPDKKLSGKTITFDMTVNEIKVRELPALDDEMAKDLNLDDVNTLEELKARLKKDMLKSAEIRADNQLNQQVTQKIAEMSNFEVPEAMIEREIKNLLEELRHNLSQSGLDINKINLDQAKLLANYRDQAISNVKAALVLDKIANENNITVSDEEIEKDLEAQAAMYQQPANIIKEFHEKNNLMEALTNRLRVQKTIDLIKSKATITEVEPQVNTEANKDSATEDNETAK